MLKNSIRATAGVLHETLSAASKAFGLFFLLLGVTSSAVAASNEVYRVPWKPNAPWHGFNLVGLFQAPWKRTDAWKPEDSAGTRSTCRNEWGFNFWSPGHFSEEHFRWMKEWGFNFARLPMDYRNFVSTNDWSVLREEGFAELDRAVAWGRRYGIHVQPCLHRAPGYTVIPNGDVEPCDLRTAARAQAAFCSLWAAFAKRYRGIPNGELSFNLLNEPQGFSEELFTKVFGDAIRAIRAEDPDRFVMLDGNACASVPVEAFYSVPLTGQSFRGYTPHAISHYGAWYIKDQPKAEPTWPIDPALIDRRWIFEMPEKTFGKFEKAVSRGYPVMIGEFGCFVKLRHETCLRWMEHCLRIWKAHDLGWALWNLDGAFGIIDSGRTDVEYEDFHGHKLDRKMLDLLRRYAK